MKHKKREGVLAVPTSSMGDISFLLIIFFMLTSKFMQESHVKYENPHSPDIQQVEDSTISVIVDEQGEIWLQGQPCGSAEAMRMGVEALRTMRGDKKDQVVLFKVHKGATQKQFGEALLNLGKAGVRVAFVGDRSLDYSGNK